MRKISIRGLLAGVLVLLAIGAGCSKKPTGPTGPRMTGSWSGSFSGGGTLSCSLTEHEGGLVTGTCTLSGPGGSLAVTVKQGKHLHPDVTMTLGAPTYYDIFFTGAFSGPDTVPGEMTGSGFVNEPVTLNRQ